MNVCPLLVDLDGTLIRTDLLQESFLKVLHNNPLGLFRMLYWLTKGKAVLQRHLPNITHFNPAVLPYNLEFLEWLQQQRQQGRKLILCTASDHFIASAIAQHLNIFDEVIAGDGRTNLSGKQKADELVQRFGCSGFDYAGSSKADLTVWERARRAVVVNAKASLAKKAQSVCQVEQVFDPPNEGFWVWLRMLRGHQWLKNLLLFVPLFAAHRFTDLDNWIDLLAAFFSFSLCASSVYILNDLLDLESDRQHPRKNSRPLASGQVPIWIGVILTPILLLSSLVLGYYVGNTFVHWIALYFALTCLYSWWLKRVLILDCLALTSLYTLRIIAGAAVAGISLSFWLLTFSVFLFLSLAFLKRYVELQVLMQLGKQASQGRGYNASDSPLIEIMGVTSGFAAVLVLALYLNSESVVRLYRAPELVWGTLPVMLFWVAWMWIKGHRGEMDDDPLMFAVKDVASLLSGIIFAATLTIAALGKIW